MTAPTITLLLGISLNSGAIAKSGGSRPDLKHLLSGNRLSGPLNLSLAAADVRRPFFICDEANVGLAHFWGCKYGPLEESETYDQS
ncbi:exported hypothetical protein [Mesorhizobium sp. ORS 3324]|nr:exported hypothetical protein [Mesorhizobium sp. ORS 3324]